MNRKMFDMHDIAGNVFMVVFIAAITGGTPMLALCEDGTLAYGVVGI